MGMVVRSNIMAVNAQRQLGMNNNQVGKALEKLSSGYRINKAGDDASGLAISEKMKSQIKGLDTASLNSQDGVSLVQTAEGALGEVHNMLNRMTELATRAANGINDDINRESLQKEIKDLKAEIDRIADSTDFNGLKLLNGEMGPSTNFIVGMAGTGASARLQTKVVLDFETMLNARSLSNFELGSTFTISSLDGKTYAIQFVGAGTTAANAAKAAGYVAVTVGATVGDTMTNLLSVFNGTAAKMMTTKVTVDGKDISNIATPVTPVALASGSKAKVEFVLNWTNATSVDQLSNEALEVANRISIKETGGMGLKLQIGATADSYNQMSVGIGNMGTEGIGIAQLDISTQKGAAQSIDVINRAIDKVSSQRATMGAVQNRLEYTINNLDTASENLQAANSRIRDTDMAKMMMEYTKMNVLTQSAQAMLAQANQQPQSVLQLLQ